VLLLSVQASITCAKQKILNQKKLKICLRGLLVNINLVPLIKRQSQLHLAKR